MLESSQTFSIHTSHLYSGRQLLHLLLLFVHNLKSKADASKRWTCPNLLSNTTWDLSFDLIATNLFLITLNYSLVCEVLSDSLVEGASRNSNYVLRLERLHSWGFPSPLASFSGFFSFSSLWCVSEHYRIVQLSHQEWLLDPSRLGMLGTASACISTR